MRRGGRARRTTRTWLVTVRRISPVSSRWQAWARGRRAGLPGPVPGEEVDRRTPRRASESAGGDGPLSKALFHLEMSFSSALEVRLEIYSDGELPGPLAARISTLLSQRWPEAWDVKVPSRPSLEHPAEWRAVVPLPEGMTPESLHGQIEAELLSLDPTRSLHFRTRWSFQESPNHQEVYEVRWGAKAT